MAERYNDSRGWDFSPEKVADTIGGLEVRWIFSLAIFAVKILYFEMKRFIAMKTVVGSVLTMLLTMTITGCGGANSGGPPPPQTGGDPQSATEVDPNAGVAFDQELMQKGMNTK